jgi:hypothetical protein
MELKTSEFLKKLKIDGSRKVENVVHYKIWYNTKTKQIQGQAPYFMVVADPDKKLPDIIAKLKEVEERDVFLLITENKKSKK